MLTRDNGAIAASLREVRYDMMVIAAAALGITVLLSLYLAGTITQPIVRLARAADDVRLARESRPEIPDLGKRGDEIGDLNDALRSMTDALWQRLNTIESFAADVAHELKNPLTWLRSAIEMAARPNLEPDRREKLMGIVMDDINRLNRLISDISDASRLDAELMRGEVKTLDLNALLRDMVQHYAMTQKSTVEVEFRVAANPPFLAHGHDGRYGQVFRNVIDNALSFSPPGSRIVSNSPASRAAGRSSSPSTTRGRASPTRTWNRSSSAFTRSGRWSISASIRGLACRSAVRSWRPTAVRSRRPTGARPTGACWVRASRYACRRPTAASEPACPCHLRRSAGGPPLARRAAARPFRSGQVRP